jgi:hypothetical protein
MHEAKQSNINAEASTVASTGPTITSRRIGRSFVQSIRKYVSLGTERGGHRLACAFGRSPSVLGQPTQRVRTVAVLCVCYSNAKPTRIDESSLSHRKRSERRHAFHTTELSSPA